MMRSKRRVSKQQLHLGNRTRIMPNNSGSMLLLLLVCFFSAPPCAEAQSTVVAGYLPDYRFAINVNETASHLTDLILFSVEPHSRGMVGGCCLDKDKYKVALQAKAYAAEHGNDLNLWVTVGGAGRTDAFLGIAEDSVKRERLIQGMIRLCERESLDGIDLDLYHPQGRQVYHDLFMVFLEEASAAWHQAGLLVSIGLHAKARMPLHAYDWVDRVNVMAYDMVEEPGDFHASLPSTQKAIQFVLDSGCPASKIVLGIPFYARHLENPQLALTFSELYDAVIGEAENGQDLSRPHEGYQWTSQQSMKKKVDYLHEAGLGGIFVWEVGQDKQTVKYPGGLLLQVVSEYMDRVKKEKEKEMIEL